MEKCVKLYSCSQRKRLLFGDVQSYLDKIVACVLLNNLFIFIKARNGQYKCSIEANIVFKMSIIYHLKMQFDLGSKCIRLYKSLKTIQYNTVHAYIQIAERKNHL